MISSPCIAGSSGAVSGSPARDGIWSLPSLYSQQADPSRQTSASVRTSSTKKKSKKAKGGKVGASKVPRPGPDSASMSDADWTSGTAATSG